MKNLKNILSGSIFAVFIISTQSVYAIPTVSANVDLSIEGNTLTDNQSSVGGAVNANVVEVSLDPEIVAGGGAIANDAGQLAVSASYLGSSGDSVDVVSTASWTETFIGSTNDTFSFVIPEAVLAFDANNAGPLSGMFEVSILLNNIAIFNSITDITTVNGFLDDPTDFSVTQTGTALNSVFSSNINNAPNILGTATGFTFAEFSDSLNLNSIAGGDNTLRYKMTARVSGRLGETAALASIGDPLNLNQLAPVQLLQSATPVSVSEPNAIILLFIAMLTFLTAGIRKNNS